MAEARVDEARIIDGLLSGNEETIETLRSWIRLAFTPYRKRLGPELEDLEQDVLLALMRDLELRRFEKRSSLRTYVRAVAHHKCIDRLRAASRRRWIDITEADLPSDASSVVERLSDQDDLRLALRVVELMPESCRNLWRMLEQGMSQSEMAEKLGIKDSALRARVFRCREKALDLRRELLRGNEKDGDHA